MCLLWAHVLLSHLRCPTLYTLLRHICKHYCSAVVHLVFLFIVVWKPFFLPFFCLLPSCHSFVQGETLAPLAAPHPSREISTQKNSFTQRRMGEQSRYCAPPKTKVWLLSTQEDNSAFWQKVRVALKHVFYETWTSLKAMRRCSQVAPIQSRLASCPVAPFIFLLLPFLVNITCWLALCNATVLWNPAKSLPGG